MESAEGNYQIVFRYGREGVQWRIKKDGESINQNRFRFGFWRTPLNGERYSVSDRFSIGENGPIAARKLKWERRSWNNAVVFKAELSSRARYRYLSFYFDDIRLAATDIDIMVALSILLMTIKS
ncbi:MAG: hypothetical protein AAFV80_23525 [Bacteroidota bacterium]